METIISWIITVPKGTILFSAYEVSVRYGKICGFD